MRPILLIVSLIMLNACQTTPTDPIEVASPLDLDRFMGQWYVIANIPTFPEKGAYNAIETYRRAGPNEIATTFTFRKDGPDGELKTMTATGFVSDENPAIWKMRFLWPFKADFRVLYVSPDYQTTIVGRQKRDYLWIMARSPQLDASVYQHLLDTAKDRGYSLEKLQKVPQVW
ncbi:lipocalin family protein [uncultured Alcanivorax sp.]|jgi:apolipoprotein D and lipocalin family protein|uniref:lipocalin family protein n=1 Tax=uncultured Alcanivorax sp. TaxID=191215 RepID=UPI0025D271E7|nr:lipocalin family protein [uncultured Alcanivorax sp.]